MKDVILEKSRWKQTRQSLYHASEAGNSGSVPSTYAAAYSQTSPYYNSSTSYGNYSGLSGFAKDINEIIEVSKSIRELIDSKDEDGVCYYSFHDEVSAARTVQGKLDTLMRYACQVERAIENQIDHTFYEEIDRVIYDLEQLQIQKYKTKNIIGYQRKETITDEYGQPMEYMVIPKDVSITDLYSVDNIYSEQLKGEYQKFKKEQPDIELSESDYLVSTLNPRYFSYDSLYEQQMHIENVRNYLLLGTTIVASIFCPPVILTTMGFIFGALEVGSAIGGRDYLTNRKMDKNERIFRGIFGAMDMLPGVVAITKQFEPGRKLISAISDLKAKSINFVKDTYSLGKTKLNAAYNSMLTKVDDFENAIIRQLDDVLVGNTQLRPAFAGIPSDLGDDVVKGIDDVVKGVDDVVNKQNSSLSRGEYLRQKYNIHLTSEELNYRIELRQYVHDEAERLTMGLSKNQIRKQVGPAVAGVYDPATKKFYLGTNHLSGSKPDDIVEILDIRIKNIPDTIDQSFIRTSGIGSHAELYALNKALLERQKLGLSQNLDDLYVYVVNTYSTTRNPASFMPIPRCPHCEYITQGSKYFPEVLKYGKTAK